MDGITEDDDLIMELIEDAFNFVELVCGLSLVPTQISTTLEVLNRIELPYGPIIGDLIISSTVSSTALSNPLPDTGFVLFSACTGSYFATYTAGYVNWVDVPAGIKGAIKAYIAYCYEHRGDDYDVSDPGFASVAMRKLFPYKRTLGV